jgi:hypothetical protein
MNFLKNKTLIACFPEKLDLGITRNTRIELISGTELTSIKISQTTKHNLTENVVDEIYIESIHWDMLADAIITCCEITQNEEL